MSATDGKSYTVQYFERAVFEEHPENSEPYRVLLSQLGTFRYRAKYKTHVTAGNVVAGPDMAIERSCHSATLLGSGKVLIAGGMIRDGVFSANAELYDPATGEFAPTGSLNRERACHTATLLKDGRVLVVGGDWDYNMDSAEIYDPATAKFVMVGSLNQGRNGAPATLLNDGKVLIAGGFEGGHESVMLKSAEIYDPATGRFTLAGDLLEGRATSGASFLPDGRVLITGGGKVGTALATAEIYDPATRRFSTTGSMSVPRHKHAQVALDDGRVLVLGGADGRDWRGQYSEAEIYDPATGRFSTTGSMQDRRFKFAGAITTIAGGKVAVSGGGSDVEVYDPANGVFAAAAGALDTSRYFQTATRLSNGDVLIAGGYDVGIVSTRRTWIYRP